jgi:hypothetical protein
VGETAIYAAFEVALARARLPVVPIRLNAGKFVGMGAFLIWRRWQDGKGPPLKQSDWSFIEGAPTGTADFVVLLPEGATVFVEFKSAKGKQREGQERFQQAVEARGHTYVLERSVEAAVAAVALRSRARGIIPAVPPPMQA